MTDPFAASRLDGKIALVTGAAQGIGESAARLLAARGAAGIVLVDRNRERGEAVAADLAAAGTPAVFVHADLAVPAEVDAVVPAAQKAFGRLDILANVAGITDRGTILDTDLALFDRMFAVNVRAPFFLMQGALRLMLEAGTGGTVVNVLSMNAHVGSPNLTPYSASKGALLNLTKNVAHSVNANRIRVNGIALGWVDTPGEHETLKKFHGAGPDWLAAAEASQPFGRLIKTDDVARVIAFLASAESAPMTGAVIDYEQRVFGASGAPLGYPRPA